MTQYARIYRTELRDLNTPIYRRSLRLSLAFFRWIDSHPRAASFFLWLAFLWMVWHIFWNYPI